MSRTAREMMNPELFKVEGDDYAGQVLIQLIDLEVSACPIVRSDGRLQAIATLRSLAAAERDAPVSTMASRGMTVSEDASVDQIADLMAETGEHHVVVVTPTGFVLGIVSTIDVLRELRGGPPRWPDPFPHFDTRYDIHWSDQLPLEYSRVHAAPSGRGVFSLICKSADTDDHIVWTEYSESIRDRLLDLIAEPTAEVPAICSVLETRLLRFRTAVVPDEERGRKVVDSLQRLSGYAVET